MCYTYTHTHTHAHTCTVTSACAHTGLVNRARRPLTTRQASSKAPHTAGTTTQSRSAHARRPRSLTTLCKLAFSTPHTSRGTSQSRGTHAQPAPRNSPRGGRGHLEKQQCVAKQQPSTGQDCAMRAPGCARGHLLPAPGVAARLARPCRVPATSRQPMRIRGKAKKTPLPKHGSPATPSPCSECGPAASTSLGQGYTRPRGTCAGPTEQDKSPMRRSRRQTPPTA